MLKNTKKVITSQYQEADEVHLLNTLEHFLVINFTFLMSLGHKAQNPLQREWGNFPLAK